MGLQIYYYLYTEKGIIGYFCSPESPATVYLLKVLPQVLKMPLVKAPEMPFGPVISGEWCRTG
jgi:hypothetical protein